MCRKHSDDLWVVYCSVIARKLECIFQWSYEMKPLSVRNQLLWFCYNIIRNASILRHGDRNRDAYEILIIMYAYVYISIRISTFCYLALISYE